LLLYASTAQRVLAAILGDGRDRDRRHLADGIHVA
jgi:hypothetical protein